MLNMTQHARVRIQQRGIPEDVLETLLDFGRETHDHHGSLVVYFDRHARAEIKRAQGHSQYRRIEARLDTYAVIALDGEIVTVGHRTRRIRRH